MTASHRVAAVVAVLALAASGACGSGTDSGSGADSVAAAGASRPETGAPFDVDGEPEPTNDVTLPRSYKFEPKVVEVDAGSTVTWTNEDDFPHNVHLYGPNETTKDLRVGGTASVTFDEPGTFVYDCTLHPSQMKGKVVVVDA